MPETAAWALCCLDGNEALRFGEHMLACVQCQRAVSEFEGPARLLRSISVPAGLRERTLRRLRRAATAG